MNAIPFAPWLFVLRLYAGCFWLSHGWGKITSPEWSAPGGTMASILAKMAAGAQGPYHDFLTGVVVPNQTTFAHLVAWGETLTGVSLLLGLLTPLGALGGMFLPLNYMLAKGVDLDAAFGMDALAIFISFLCLVLPVGRVAGLDSVLFRRQPTRPAVRAAPR